MKSLVPARLVQCSRVVARSLLSENNLLSNFMTAVKLQLLISQLEKRNEHCNRFSCVTHDVTHVTRLALCAYAAGSTFIQRQTTAWLTKTAERMQ